MRRITPEEVVRAYREKGLRPERFETIPRDGTCCGMAAVLWDGVADEFDVLWYQMADEFGCDYRSGFVCGFDGVPPILLGKGRWIDGYEDGKVAWEACMNEDWT